MKRKSKRRSSLKRKNFYKRSRKIRRTRKRRTNTKKERRTRKKMAMRGGAAAGADAGADAGAGAGAGAGADAGAGAGATALDRHLGETKIAADRLSPTQITSGLRRGSIIPSTAAESELEGFRPSPALPSRLEGIGGPDADAVTTQDAAKEALNQIGEEVTEEMVARMGPEALATYSGESLNLAEEQSLSQGQAREQENAATQHAAMVESTKQVITNLGTRIRANDVQITRYQEVIKKLISEIKIKTKEYEVLKSTSTDSTEIAKRVEQIEALKQQLGNMEKQYKDKLIMYEVYKTMATQIMEKFKNTTDDIKQLLEEKREQSRAITAKIKDNLQKMVQNYIFLKYYVYPAESIPQDLQVAITEGITLLDSLGVKIEGQRPSEELLLRDIQGEITQLKLQTGRGENPIYQDGIEQSAQFLLNQDNSEKLIAEAIIEIDPIHNNKNIELAMKVIELESINDLLSETENIEQRQILKDSRLRVIEVIQQLGVDIRGLSQEIQDLILAPEPDYVQPPALE